MTPNQNPPITIQIADADPNAAPLTINELIAIFRPLFTASIGAGSEYRPYIKQQTTPSVGDQDKAWIELDSAGRPLSTKIFYNGNWRRIYNGMIGEVRMYNGDPTDATVWTQPWNSAPSGGHGVVGGLYDGWQICNGNNGSPSLANNFMVAGSAYDSGVWKSTVDGTGAPTPKQFGGSKDHMIVAADLPPIDPTHQSNQLFLNGFAAKDTVDHGENVQPIIDGMYGNLHPHSTLLTTYGSNPGGSPPTPQTPIPTLPPWVAIGFIVFQGY